MMTLEQFWSLLVKRWKLIVACIVIVAVGTYVGSRLITPIYQSTVLVRVAIHTTSNTADYNGLLASDQLVQTEALLATSDPVLRDVVTRYPGLTVDQLAKTTTATSRLNTQVFAIDVQDTSPPRAAALANDIAATLIKQQMQENQQDNRRSEQQLQLEVDTTHQRMNDIQSKVLALQLQIAGLQLRKGTQIQILNLQTQIAGLQNQLNGLQDHYTQWQTTLLQLETIEAQNNNFLRVAQPAQPARSPVRPQLLLNTAAGLAVGLLFGLLLALLFEQLDTRVRTPEDVVQLLKWPTLGVIWRGDNASKGKKGDLVDLNLSLNKRRINAEPYRILRTNIGFLAVNKPVRLLMVTSALPNEGKSTVASNLAIFMAKAGKSTLLIDADLRHPSLQQKFHLTPEKKGLSNAIMAVAQAQSGDNDGPSMHELEHVILQKNISSTDIPNLYVMTAGSLPPNPPEMLESRALDNLLGMIKRSGIDQVIFDTSPLLGLSDTGILMSKVDGVLVVVDITRAKSKMLKSVKEILMQTNANILGSVINKQQSNRGSIPYYYYQGAEEEKASQNGHSPVFVSSSNSSSDKEFGPNR